MDIDIQLLLYTKKAKTIAFNSLFSYHKIHAYTLIDELDKYFRNSGDNPTVKNLILKHLQKNPSSWGRLDEKMRKRLLIGDSISPRERSMCQFYEDTFLERKVKNANT